MPIRLLNKMVRNNNNSKKEKDLTVSMLVCAFLKQTSRYRAHHLVDNLQEDKAFTPTIKLNHNPLSILRSLIPPECRCQTTKMKVSIRFLALNILTKASPSNINLHYLYISRTTTRKGLKPLRCSQEKILIILATDKFNSMLGDNPLPPNAGCNVLT